MGIASANFRHLTKLLVFRNGKDRWQWELHHRDGKGIARSLVDYSRKTECIKAARKIGKHMDSAELEEL